MSNYDYLERCGQVCGNGDGVLTADESFGVTLATVVSEVGANVPLSVDGESLVRYIDPDEGCRQLIFLKH